MLGVIFTEKDKTPAKKRKISVGNKAMYINDLRKGKTNGVCTKLVKPNIWGHTCEG